jgi:hypothetical protein
VNWFPGRYALNLFWISKFVLRICTAGSPSTQEPPHGVTTNDVGYLREPGVKKIFHFFLEPAD